jgi:hypothetical protein
MRELLKKYGFVPDKLVTDDRRSYAAAAGDLQNAMNAGDGATIEPRIRINRPDEGSARCKGSRAWGPRFSQCMQQHKILSTSSAISPQQERTEPSGHRPCRRGVKSSLRREPDVRGDLLRARFVNVTEPAGEPKSRLPFAFLSFTPGHAIGELDAGADFADCRFPTRC